MSSGQGVGSISFARRGDRTFVKRAYATSPLRILTPSKGGDGGWAYLATFGGGLVDGDAISVEARVEAGATAFLGTQASTKVYRSPRGVSQSFVAAVEDDALLAVVPDPTVCFADARYVQRIAIDLAPHASLAFVDALGGGRVARGERWAFERWESRITITRSGEERLVDATALDAVDGPIARRLGRFAAIATVILAGARVSSIARAILDDVSTRSVSRDDALVESASPFDDGALYRIAATEMKLLNATVHARLAAIAPILGGDPWSRRH